jgi:hypothetical protein
MSLSDDDLRRALAARAERASGRQTVDDRALGQIAHAIASSDPMRRTGLTVGRFRWSIAAACAFAAVGIVLAVAVAPRPTASGPVSISPAHSTTAGSTPATPEESASSRLLPAASAAVSSLVIRGCDALGFSAVRCRAIVTRAEQAMVPPVTDEDVAVATVMAPVPNGVSLGSFDVADVRLDLVNKSAANVPVRCRFMSGASDRACSENAKVVVNGGVSHDVPCPGGNPGGETNPCATPPPSPRPASVASSTPLRVPALDVSLDHLGHYEMFVGNAWLPDGALSERSATIANPRPTTFWINDGVTIEVRPDGPCPGTCPVSIESIYHEPFDGSQEVRVYLVFEVVEVRPGAVLEVRDILVR